MPYCTACGKECRVNSGPDDNGMSGWHREEWIATESRCCGAEVGTAKQIPMDSDLYGENDPSSWEMAQDDGWTREEFEQGWRVTGEYEP